MQFPVAGDVVPNQLTLGQSQVQGQQLVSITGSSGDRETPISGSSKEERPATWNWFATGVPRSGRSSRCQMKVSRAKGGGLIYRAGFMLHSVLLADHVRLGRFEDGRMLFR